MKSSDLKVVAIILSIALFFTIITSNAVSIASVVILAKGGSGTGAATQTVAPGTGDQQNTQTTPGGTTSTTPGDTSSTTPGGTTSTTPGGTTSTTPGGTTSTTPGGSTSTTPQGGTQTTPQGGTQTTPQGGTQATPQGGTSAGAIDQAALKIFQDAVNDIKNNASAGYKNKAWQEVKEINIGNEALANIITGFVTSEEKAETKDNAKGSDDSKNRMPASNPQLSEIQSVKQEKKDGNLVITIVMKDKVNPEEGKDGVALMSRDLLYMTAITNEIQNNAAIKAIVRDLEKAELNYQQFTVVATMSADGKQFKEITHYCDAALSAKAKLLVGSLEGDGVLTSRARYWDFVY